MVVEKDQGHLAASAIQHGIKRHNGKGYTASLEDIISRIGKAKQWDFINYCEAYRVLDLLNRKNGPIIENITKEEAEQIIADVKKTPSVYKEWEQARKDFVEYNNELLWVMKENGFISEKSYNNWLANDPNYIPLNKKLQDEEDLSAYFYGSNSGSSLVDVRKPFRRIKGSTKEIRNPFQTMLERTVDYYRLAGRNQAGKTFVEAIVNAEVEDENGRVTRP